MKFKNFFTNLFIFLGLSIFIANAKWPKSNVQVQYDMIKAEQKIMHIAQSNPNLSYRLCEKITLEQHNLHEKYDDFFSEKPIYLNINFINHQKLWAENYDFMGLPGFSELVRALYRHNISDIMEANTYIFQIYRKLALYFQKH